MYIHCCAVCVFVWVYVVCVGLTRNMVVKWTGGCPQVYGGKPPQAIIEKAVKMKELRGRNYNAKDFVLKVVGREEYLLHSAPLTHYNVREEREGGGREGGRERGREGGKEGRREGGREGEERDGGREEEREGGGR